MELGKGLWSVSGRYYQGVLCVRVTFILDKCIDIIYTSTDEKNASIYWSGSRDTGSWWDYFY